MPGEYLTIFNERGALIVFFGALGGVVRSAVLRTTWREGLRVAFIGGATAFGVGALAPVLLGRWIGPLPDGASAALGTLCASAFIIGLICVTFIEMVISGRALKQEEKDV